MKASNYRLKALLGAAVLAGAAATPATAQNDLATWDFTNAVSGTTSGTSVLVGIGVEVLANTEVSLAANLSSTGIIADTVWNGSACGPSGLQWSGGGWVASGELNLQKWDGDVPATCGVTNDGVNDNYVGFTLTATSGTISFDEISMNLWRNGAGAPSNLAVEVAVDGSPAVPFGATVDVAGTGSGAHAWQAWTGSVSGATTVEVRFVPADGPSSSAGTGNIHIDGWKVTTSVTNSGNGYCFGDGTGGSCPCSAFGGIGEGCANTGGTGATLVGSGLATFSADSFQLDIAGVPGDKPGLVLRGDNQVTIPAGDGILCASGGSMRSQVQITSAGVTSYTDFNGAPFGAVSNSGAPTNFQFWYRDPANICSGGGFNFTNGWTVTYTP